MAHDASAMVTLDDVAEDGPETVDAEQDLVISDNRAQGIYEAKIGDETVAGIVYGRTGSHVTILATNVFPQHRGKGIAGRLLGRVLDDLKEQNATATVRCPFATTYLASHPEHRSVLAPKGTA